MSTAIAEIDYDEAWETLAVRFTDGKLYKYWNVPLDVYVEFLYAPSSGEYFNAKIRNNYSYREG